MDRRKLRRLLASSSFAALLAAGDTARAQSLTNPAGSTTAFLKVNPGETFDDVINFGLITSVNGPAAIEVEGDGAVTGNVSNAQSVFVRDTVDFATGILVDGTSASIGGRIRNVGVMDVSADGIGTGFHARGIAVEGTNTFIDGGDGGAILNSAGRGLTVDVIANSQELNEAGGNTTASAGGTATGIFVGTDVTLGDRIENEGGIDVGAHIFATATADGGSDVDAKAVAGGNAYGVRILSATAPSFQNQHSDQTGNAFIDVEVSGTAKAIAKAIGVAALASASADAHGQAFGVNILSNTIAGGDTNGIDHDGLIDVVNSQHAAASAIAEGGSAPLSEATALAAANASANGIAVIAGVLTGGYETNGTMHVTGTASAKALADAEAVTGAAHASAVVSPANVIARGVNLDINTVIGGITNRGLIDVQALGTGYAKAEANAVDGKADAVANAAVLANATGFDGSGDQLAGDYETSATILATATVRATMLANATAQDANDTANATALLKALSANAFGVFLVVSTVEGDIANSGSVSVAAHAVITGTGEAGFAAEAKGPAGAHAQANGGAQAEAVGVLLLGSSLAGSVENRGDLVAIGDVRATGFASATMNKAGFAGATVSFSGTGQAVGLRVAFNTIDGDVANSGAIDVTGTVDYAAKARATNGGGSAVAIIDVDSLFATAHAIELNFSSLAGDFENFGTLAATAQIHVDVDATATGASENGPKEEAALALIDISQATAQATGIKLHTGPVTVGGDFHNSGRLDAVALLTITAFAQAKANKSDAAALVILQGTQEPEIYARARGIDLQPETVGGDIVNEGGIHAAALLQFVITAEASSPDTAAAGIRIDPIVASATGINVTATSVGGAFENNATLDIAALIGSVTSGGVTSPAFAKAGALVTAGAGFAAATITVEDFAGVFGADLHIQTLSGGVHNAGDILGKAIANIQVTAAADNEGEGGAFAQVNLFTHGAAATGMHLSASSLGGGFLNDGLVGMAATAILAVKASAISTGNTATALVLDDAKNTVRDAGFATASGFLLNVDSVSGDVTNAGTLLIHALAVASFSMLADNDDGNALARLGSSNNDLNLGAFATGFLLVPNDNVGVTANRMTGDFRNDGSIFANATLDVRGIRGTDNAMRIVAQGLNNATAEAHLAFRGGAAGVVVDVDSFFGNFTNSGSLSANAGLNAIVDVSATADTNAVANLRMDYDIRAAGLIGVFNSTLAGDAVNNAKISALAAAHIGGTSKGAITAVVAASASNAAASLDAASVFAQARGFELKAGDVGGNLINSGDVRATASIDIDYAVAAVGKTFASAVALFRHVSLSAVAWAAVGGEVEGDIVNSGALAAQANLRLSASADAQSLVAPKAYLNLNENTAEAVGLQLSLGTASGQVLNEGTIQARASGTLHGDAFAGDRDPLVAKVFNVADASIEVTSASALALGVSLDGGSLSGGVLNEGQVFATAVLHGGFNATASGGLGGASAQATIRLNPLTTGSSAVRAAAIAYDAPIDTMSGGFRNEGTLAAKATMALGTDTDLVRALLIDPGFGANARVSVNRVSALAEGAEFTGDRVNGGVVNAGNVLADAKVSAYLWASGGGTSNVINAAAVVAARSMGARAIGILLDGPNFGTLNGGMLNEGFVSAQATGFLRGTAQGTAGISVGVSALTDEFRVAAAGLFVDTGADLVDGGFANGNGGVIVAAASADIRLLAIGEAGSGGGVVARMTDAEIRAYGMYASGLATLNGGMTNSGDIHAKAEGHGTAITRRSGNVVTLFAQVDLQVTAIGMGAFGTGALPSTLNGDLLNEGLVMVTASAFANATASNGAIVPVASGTVQAKAAAHATGMAVNVFSLNGDLVNDGTMVVKAFASADAFGAVESVSALAIAVGILGEVTGFASGGIVNRGEIYVSAKANAPALAVGQGIEGGGGWAGSILNDGLLSVFASDPVSATAAGMGISGSASVAGGLENRGEILAEAVGSGAVARAIDITAATGTGHSIRMVDGVLEAFTRASALATVTNAGSAVAMQGNVQADTLDWSGGLILANVIGTSLDTMNVFAGVDSVLNFSDTIDGVGAINVNTPARAGTPVEFRINGVVQNVTDLNVNENGTLVVGLDATIAPTNLNMDPDGIVLFEINAPGNQPPDAGVIDVNAGQANLTGLVGIRPQAGFYEDVQTYVSVIDGPLANSFADELNNTPLLTVEAVHRDPDVDLVVRRVAFNDVPGLTHNEKELSNALEDFYDPAALAGTEIGEVVGELFTLNTDELLDAYDELHGAQYAQMAYAAFESMEFVLGGVNQRLHDARSRSSGAGQSASLGNQSLQYAAIAADEGIQGTQMAAIGNDPDHPGSVWGKGYGSWGSLDGDDEAPGYDRTTGAIVVGLDYRFDNEFLVGIVGAYSFSNLDFDDGDSGDIDSFQIGLFGSWDSGTWYVDGLVSYAFQSYDTERHIDFGSISEKATADYDGGAVQVYGEVGYQFEMGEQALVTPLLGLGYTSVWTDSFTETGGSGANLRVDDASFDSLATTLGVRGSLNLDGWEPSLFLGWRHEFLDDHGEADVAFAAVPDSKWQVIGSDIGSDAGLIGVGVVAEISAQFEAVIDYGGQFSGSGSNHTGSIGLRLKF